MNSYKKTGRIILSMMVANEPPFFLSMPGSGGWGQSPIKKWPHTATPQTAGRKKGAKHPHY